ncbi:uncharacterized protein LOC113675335 [Pocillopora damicornis]|uniref:uncharacterized protein LOC113675335 n=1 Tax=Pocillopora damicornis TaxID=46731 RepID=UPI000F554B54|nr:uncharacterized protein LOC113675335 [Pocillopora damicornis]
MPAKERSLAGKKCSEIRGQCSAGDHSFKKKRFLPQDTMKFGCTASIRLSEVITYPSYKIRDDTERLRRDMSKKLKTDTNSGQKPPYERRIYIYLPKEDEHKDHITGEVC